MTDKIISINNKVEQETNKFMAKRFHRQAARVRELREMINDKAFDLYSAGVLPSEIAKIDKHLRDVFALNKAMALGEDTDEMV